ncbi:hypothetical protein NDA17_003088 [Ustilago hordei]|nr:hypothetical protein NDA17_003088 [Ustilago hordei]
MIEGVLFIPKKDGGLRLCVDYRGLNEITRCITEDKGGEPDALTRRTDMQPAGEEQDHNWRKALGLHIPQLHQRTTTIKEV